MFKHIYGRAEPRKGPVRALWTSGIILLLALIGCNGGGSGDGGTGAGPNAGPASQAQTLPVIKDKKSGLDMLLIPAGSFKMGSTTGQDDEKPVHTVYIDSFLMDRTEVTQAVFEKIGREAEVPMANPSRFKGADRPVEQVKMDQAMMFCNARSVLEGLDPCYNDNAECDFGKNGYRLPTEAEWEYACRAGTDTDYSFGNSAKLLGDHGWYSDNAAKQTHPVGQKQANPWGLVDMHGNVAEWCHDVYSKDYYKESSDKNPHGPKDGKDYVLRGGSWKSTATALRSSHRLGETPGFSDACLAKDAIGFRCVRKAP